MKILLRLILVMCVAGTSIAQADKKRDEKQVGGETEFTTVIETETNFGLDACMASLEIEYYQKGSSAHVETELSNNDCDASSGTYVIQIRYKDAAGEHQAKNFEETWERSDANAIIVRKDYFVADDIDILRVRSRKLKCTCTPDEAADSD